MASLKEQGGAAFKAKEFDKAIGLYTQAIEADGSDHTLYSNRSACYYNMNKFQEAAEDGQKCIDVKADWGKGYMRKAMALHGMHKYEEAIPIYKKGVEIEPANKQLTDGLARCEEEKIFSETGPQGGAGMGGGPGGMGDMFGPAGMAKLMANPRTAQYFQDPQFKTMFEMCKQQPQMLMQVMQSDPRFMDVFQVLTGIDLMGMQQEYQKSQDKAKDDDKQKQEELKKQKEEEDRKKKEAEEAQLPDDERKKIQDKKDAEAKKADGNAAYKKKDFENALKLYQDAIDLNPEELTYYTNKSAVYLEMKEFDKGIEECDKAIKETKGKPYDYAKLAKAMARKATCQMRKGDLEEAIDTYKNALLEDNSVQIKDQLKKAEKIQKEEAAKKYINPEIAEQHKKKGDELFKEGKYPAAIKEYDEAVRRDPENKNIFSNRCLTYVKLMEPAVAMKDAERCLAIDPNFIKGYIRKASCHSLMKEYHKALQAYEQGLKVDPENKECKDGYAKTIQVIQMSAGAHTGNDEERMRHAMADPEIQGLMRDPRVQQCLKEMQENPKAAQDTMKDPFIAEAINKLIAAGVIKVQ